MNFKCYYCKFSTDFEHAYLKHGALKHFGKPLFPNEPEMIRYQLEPQNRQWEKPFGTEEQVKERLAIWAEKRMKEEKEKPPPEPKEVKTYSYTEGYLFTRTTLDDYDDQQKENL
jgi:hypothetical protein